MTTLLALWLPILLSAVVVFILSAIIQMMTGWHKSDFGTLPNEDKVRDSLRPLSIPPGEYMVPRPASMEEMKSDSYKAKLKEGPVLMMTVMEGGSAGMGGKLLLWFCYSIVVGIFAGYVCSRALPVGAHYLSVFRFAGTTSFLGYSLALWQLSIWYARPWTTTIKNTLDGLLYALVTAGMFGWLWPR